MTLNELKVGQSAVVLGVGGQGGLRQHFLDMGIIPGTVVTLQNGHKYFVAESVNKIYEKMMAFEKEKKIL